jgi:hypothetical protein
MVPRLVPLFLAIVVLSTTASAQPVVEQMASDIKDIKAILQKLSDRVGVHDNVLTELVETQREHGVQIGQTIKKDSNGRYFVPIDAQHQPTRNAIQNIIEDVTPKTGKLLIHNQSDFDQYISVRGMTYFVMAGDSLPPITMPIGEVRWKLRGEQEKRGFMITPPYEYKVTIRNRAPQPAVMQTTYLPYYAIQ